MSEGMPTPLRCFYVEGRWPLDEPLEWRSYNSSDQKRTWRVIGSRTYGSQDEIDECKRMFSSLAKEHGIDSLEFGMDFLLVCNRNTDCTVSTYFNFEDCPEVLIDACRCVNFDNSLPLRLTDHAKDRYAKWFNRETSGGQK